MQYTKLGKTRLRVSRLYFKKKSFRGMLKKTESKTIVEKAIDYGITSFDAPNAYLISKESITVPIIGVTTINLDEAVEAIGLKVSGKEVNKLEELY